MNTGQLDRPVNYYCMLNIQVAQLTLFEQHTPKTALQKPTTHVQPVPLWQAICFVWLKKMNVCG